MLYLRAPLDRCDLDTLLLSRAYCSVFTLLMMLDFVRSALTCQALFPEHIR